MSKKPYCIKNINGINFEIYVSKIRLNEKNKHLMPKRMTQITFKPEQIKHFYFSSRFTYQRYLPKKELNEAIDDIVKLYEVHGIL